MSIHSSLPPTRTPSPAPFSALVRVPTPVPSVSPYAERPSNVFARSFQRELAVSRAYMVHSCISSGETLPQTHEGTVSDFYMGRRLSQATEVLPKKAWYKRLLERLRPLFVFNKSVGSAMQGMG